jgi:hypothetical protein
LGGSFQPLFKEKLIQANDIQPCGPCAEAAGKNYLMSIKSPAIVSSINKKIFGLENQETSSTL